MLGLWRKKNANVLTHWYVLLEGFNSSTTEFYSKVENEIARREIPGLESSRIIMGEGRFASAQREYLRMRRERLVIDVCSAPFGTGWFFSCRLAEIPFRLRIWELAVVLLLLTILFGLFPATFGWIWGSVAFGLTLFAILALFNALSSANSSGLDEVLMKLPILGAVYELFVRKNTSYYRVDTRLMYKDAVNAIVESSVRSTASDCGIGDIAIMSASAGESPLSLIDQLKGVFRKES